MKRTGEENPTQPQKKKSAQVDNILNDLKNYQNEWGLDSNAINEALQRITEDGADLKGDSLLLFLYAKGIFAEKSSFVRNEEFKELLGENKFELALERLQTIVTRGETTPENTPVGSSPKPKSYFEAFVEQHPEWEERKKSNFVVFRDHSKLKGKEHALVERFQKSGLCYMHAPVVLQHYLVAMANDEPIPMLDMTQYMKQKISAKNLYTYIWENKGGDSFGFLKSILFERLTAKDIIDFSPSRLQEANLCEHVLKYGPALVSGFGVADEFKDANQWCHTGNQTIEFLEMHAMILVGYRKFKDNDCAEKTHYLLQNWWKSKAYVEVDIDFLISSDTTVRFITKVQRKMGDFPVNTSVLVECDVDACEQFNLEAEYFPAGHVAQAVAPPGEHVPAKHWVHEDCPVKVVYEHAGQEVHVPAPAAEYVPDAQSEHDLE